MSSTIIQRLDLHSETNPMMNNVVLKHLFHYVPHSDLKNCRRVCKMWWDESLPAITSKSVIRIRSSEIYMHSAHSYEEYVVLITAPDDKYLSLQKFKNFHFILMDGNKIREVCTKFGVQMKHLIIERGRFYANDFKAILYDLVPNLKSLSLIGNFFWKIASKKGDSSKIERGAVLQTTKGNLKSLSINLRRDDYVPGLLSEGNLNRNKMLPLTWLDIFRLYPAITALKLENIESYGSDPEFDKVLDAMKTIAESTERKWKLEKLDIISLRPLNSCARTFLSPFVCSYFQQLQFPLSSLFFSVGPTGSGAGPAIELLQMHSTTLQHLKLFHIGPLDFPIDLRFESLSTLHLIGKGCPNFLRSTPNLKVLWVEGDLDKDEIEILGSDPDLRILNPFHSETAKEDYPRYPGSKKFNRGEPSESLMPILNTNLSDLDHLVLPLMEELVLVSKKICPPKQLCGVMKLMPNLTRLRIGLNNDGFRVICNGLKKLTALDILPCQVDECGITGCVPGLEYQQPNITLLKDLKYFGIGRVSSRQNVISENGILHLCNLKDLFVHCSKDMPEETFNQLRARFPKSFIQRATI